MGLKKTNMKLYTKLQVGAKWMRDKIQGGN